MASLTRQARKAVADGKPGTEPLARTRYRYFDLATVDGVVRGFLEAAGQGETFGDPKRTAQTVADFEVWQSRQGQRS